MTNRQRREFLLHQRLITEKFADETKSHPLMGPQFQQRLQQIDTALGSLLPSGPEPRLEVFFSGAPVFGSKAIDAKFLAEALVPLLEAVKSQYSAAKHGRVGERGRRRDESEARLMLAATPRGSFGVELIPPQTEDLFAEERIAEVLHAVTSAISAASSSEDELFDIIEEWEPRAFSSLKDFLQRVSEAEASIRLESGGASARLKLDQVRSAYALLSQAVVTHRSRAINGVYRGALLDGRRFNFVSDDGEQFSGKIAAEISEAEIASLQINSRVTLQILEISTTSPTGKRHRKFLLEGIASG